MSVIVRKFEYVVNTSQILKNSPLCILLRVMVLTFNNISVSLYRGGHFYWWRKPEYPLTTTTLFFSIRYYHWWNLISRLLVFQIHVTINNSKFSKKSFYFLTFYIFNRKSTFKKRWNLKFWVFWPKILTSKWV